MTKDDAELRYTPNKLFIGGISAYTSTDLLKSHFSKYGRIIDCVVMQKSGRPRGFGFVTFDNAISVNQVLGEAQNLDGRLVDVKRAVPGDPGAQSENKTTNKIFIGGLPQSVSTDELKQYFGRYGQIADAVVMLDRKTGRSRGFGFIRFVAGASGTAAAEEVLARFYDHYMEGKWIEVKRATPLDPSMPPPVTGSGPSPLCLRPGSKGGGVVEAAAGFLPGLASDVPMAVKEPTWSLDFASAPIEAAAAKGAASVDFLSLLTHNNKMQQRPPAKVASPSRKRNDPQLAAAAAPDHAGFGYCPPPFPGSGAAIFSGLPLEMGKVPEHGALYPRNPFFEAWAANLQNLESERSRAHDAWHVAAAAGGVDIRTQGFAGVFPTGSPIPVRGQNFTREDFLSIDISRSPVRG